MSYNDDDYLSDDYPDYVIAPYMSDPNCTTVIQHVELVPMDLRNNDVYKAVRITILWILYFFLHKLNAPMFESE